MILIILHVVNFVKQSQYVVFFFAQNAIFFWFGHRRVESGQPETISYWDPENLPAESHYILKRGARDFHFYDYNAATAGIGISLSAETSTDSVCPKNWRLTDRSQYLSIKDSYDRSLLTKIPIAFEFTGRVYNGEYDYWSRNTHFWTATSKNAENAYRYWLSIAEGSYDIKDANKQTLLTNLRCTLNDQ